MKKNKRKRKKLKKSVVIFFIALLTGIATNLFIGSLNIKSQYEIEDMQNKITELKEENEKLQLKINELMERERIKNIASDEGLSYNDDNIFVTR